MVNSIIQSIVECLLCTSQCIRYFKINENNNCFWKKLLIRFRRREPQRPKHPSFVTFVDLGVTPSALGSRWFYASWLQETYPCPWTILCPFLLVWSWMSVIKSFLSLKMLWDAPVSSEKIFPVRARHYDIRRSGVWGLDKSAGPLTGCMTLGKFLHLFEFSFYTCKT